MSITADGLRAEQIHIWRGVRHVLKGVTFELWPGELLHVSGANGAGKTTLLRVVSGLLRPEQGRVSWRGRPIGAAAEDYQRELAYAAHEPALKGDLTSLENLRFLVGVKRRAHVQDLRASLRGTGVGDCADLPVRVLSAGQRRRVAMARVLASRASLWVLDEPFTNLDAAGCVLMSELLAAHVRAGGMALVAAHQELNLTAVTRHLGLQA